MKKTLIAFLLLLTPVCYGDTSIKDFLAYLKGKTDQATTHISDSILHLTTLDHQRIDGAITNGQSGFNVLTNGYVGIGTTNPVVPLQVVGALQASGGGSFGGSISIQGGITVGATTFTPAYGNQPYNFGVSSDQTGSATQWRFASYSGNYGTGGTGTNQVFLAIEPNWKQTSTASATDFKINRTETSIGSGDQYLITAGVNGTNKFTVSNTGNVSASSVFASSITASNMFTVATSITNQVVTSPVGTNTVSAMWQGTYAEYLALTNKSDSTSYIITDDANIYTEVGVYRGVDAYNSTAGGVTPIVIVPNKSVYKVDIATNTTLTLSAPDINFTNRIVECKVILNMTHTNGFNITLPVGWNYAPSFVSTGEYVFAVSLTDTNKMQVVQTYPVPNGVTNAVLNGQSSASIGGLSIGPDSFALKSYGTYQAIMGFSGLSLAYSAGIWWDSVNADYGSVDVGIRRLGPRELTIADGTFSHVASGSLSLSNLTSYGTIQIVANSVTNQVITSAVSSSNTVNMVWKGTYNEYLALTNKLDTTTYIITDQAGVYDSIGIYSEKYDYNTIAPTTTVTIAQDTASYVVELSTNITIMVDTNAVNLTSKIANFQLVLNVTSTNATSPTFDPKFDWGGFVPEFTVTGRYEYACTMVGDGKIRIKQTYPTMYAWVSPEVLVELAGMSIYGWAQFTSVATTNNVMFRNSFPDSAIILFRSAFNASGNGGYGKRSVNIQADYRTAWVTNNLVTTFSNANANVLIPWTVALATGAGQVSAYNQGITVWNIGTPISIYSERVYHSYTKHRPANELEIKAYNAGWRP